MTTTRPRPVREAGRAVAKQGPRARPVVAAKAAGQAKVARAAAAPARPVKAALEPSAPEAAQEARAPAAPVRPAQGTPRAERGKVERPRAVRGRGENLR